MKWLLLGRLIQILHFGFIFGLVFFGSFMFSNTVVYFLIALTVLSQIPFKKCPVTISSNYYLKKHNPNYKIKPSITNILYDKFGRFAAFLIFLTLSLIFYISSSIIIKINI